MASVEPAILEEGAEYYDFETFSKALRSWEIRNCVTVYVRCSRTLEAAKKRVPKRRFNPRLQYYDLQYACIHGGRKFKTRSRGDRPNQTSFVKNCPFAIKVSASPDGERLVVKGITHGHNHEISEGTFQSLPKQRRLNNEEWQSMKSILATKPSNKSLQLHIRKSTGKMVTLRDLSNHANKLRRNLVKPVKTDKVHANDTTVAAPMSPSFSDERPIEPSDMYKQALCEAQKLAMMASEVSVAKFKQRLAVLSDLVNLWEMGVEAAVTGISDEIGEDDDNKTSEPVQVPQSHKESFVSPMDTPISVYTQEQGDDDANNTSESVQVPQSHKESFVSPMDTPISEYTQEVKHSHILYHVPQHGVFDNSTTSLQLGPENKSAIKISVVEDIPSTSRQSSSGIRIPNNVVVKRERQDS